MVEEEAEEVVEEGEEAEEVLVGDADAVVHAIEQKKKE